MSSRGALAALAARIGPSTWRRPVTASSGSGRRALLALAVYLAVAALVYGPTVRHPLHSTLDGGRGDVGLFLWFLANTSRAVQVGHGLLVTHALNAPYGVNAMWNTGLLLPGLLLAPLTAWAGPVLSLNVIILAGPALSAWSAYLCSGRWVTGRSARLVTGLVFGFSPAVLAASLGHYHLTLLMWVPPLLLVTADGLTGRRGPVRSGLLLGLLATLQLLTGEEVLVLVGMAGALLAVVLAVQMRSAVRSRLLPGLVTAAVAAVTTVLLAGVPLYVQFLGPMRVSGSIQAPDVYVLDPLRTVVPPSVVLLHPRWLQATLHPLPLNAAESMGYLGLPLLVLIAFVVWRRRSDVVTRTVTATAAVLWVLALGYTLHLGGIRTGIPLPWRLSARLPVLGSLLPVRWVLVIMLFVALLVGMAVETLPAAGRRRALGAALVALALLPLLPARAPVGQPTGTPSFFLSGAKALQGTVLVVPVPRPLHDEAMTWAAEAGARFAMPGGYFIGPQGGRGPGADRPRFGDVPRPTERVLLDLASNGLLRPISLAERVRARADFRFWGVRSVVLGPARHEQALLLWLTRLLNRAPVADDGVWLWAPVLPTQI